MGLAVQTTASTAEIWVIVIVMSILTFVLCAAPGMGSLLQRRAAANRTARPDWPAEEAGGVAVPPPRSGQRGEAELPYAGSGAKRDGEPGR